MSSCQVVVWVRSFIKLDLFDNDVPFNNTTPIYLINMLWKLGLGLGLDLESHYFRIFAENNEHEHLTLFIMYIVPRYPKNNAKKHKERKPKKHTKTYKNTSHGAYIVHNRLFIWPEKPTGQCCLTISDKYTLKQQINLMYLNFSNLRPHTRMYSIRYKSRIICKNVGNIKTVFWAVQNITSNKWTRCSAI